MLTETSKTAVQALIYVTRAGDQPCSPAKIAENVGASPSYLAKINTLLVKADLLRTFRGKYGGVRLSRAPGDVSLLQIVEACQGRILGDYCQEYPQLADVCGFHHAMDELQAATIQTLSKWTLADLVARPGPTCDIVSCRINNPGG